MARSEQSRVAPEVPVSPASTPAPAERVGPGPRPVRRAAGRPAPAARELWLAVHLPHYVLDSLQPGASAPVVVVDLERGAKVVCDRDAGAAAAGVASGMALNSALALQPGLRVLSRDPRRERVLLETVATAALDFTPRVTLEPPDAVLLEVRGSLGLFGGVRQLCASLRQRLPAGALEPRIAVAPAPLAALWFARAGEEVALRRPDALAARLAPLPLAVTRWPQRTLESLATMGVRRVGECLRLPRDGLARRFGPRLRLDLDRALGRAHDPRVAFAAVGRFVTRRDLEPELADVERLRRACEPLLDELCGFLESRGAGVDALELRLLHREAAATRLPLRFAEPVASVERIMDVLREKLAGTALDEPVRVLQLRSGPLVEAGTATTDLFARDRRRGTAVPQLVERLRARLGADAVYGLRVVPEHRPERNGESGDIPGGRGREGSRGRKPAAPGPAADGVVAVLRPVWLLAVPQPLEGGEQPRYEGRLALEEGPERIESGWWDGQDVCRDYYVARTPAGIRLWIFRERRRPGGWFLHGVFG